MLIIFLLVIFIVNICYAGNGIFTQKLEDVDELMPYPPYPSYPSGLKDKDNAIYRYGQKTSDFPNLTIVNAIYDKDGNVIMPGYYGLVLSDERDLLFLIQGDCVVATVPVFRFEEDRKKIEKLRDKKYQKKLVKEQKKQARLDAKRAKSGVPPVENQVYMDATIEYSEQGQYYLIKYERERIRAWGAIKSY